MIGGVSNGVWPVGLVLVDLTEGPDFSPILDLRPGSCGLSATVTPRGASGSGVLGRCPVPFSRTSISISPGSAGCLGDGGPRPGGVRPPWGGPGSVATTLADGQPYETIAIKGLEWSVGPVSWTISFISYSLVCAAP